MVLTQVILIKSYAGIAIARPLVALRYAECLTAAPSAGPMAQCGTAHAVDCRLRRQIGWHILA